MQQHVNLHTLEYSILANFLVKDIIEQDIIKRNITLNENSVWLLFFSERSKFAYNVRLINFTNH